MLRITEVAFTGYPITNIARSRAFYEGVLKLKTGATFEHEGRHWVEYDIGSATLAISNMAGEMWMPSKDGPSVALEVEDFDAAMEALKAASVPFVLEPMGSGVCRLAIISDPDGNALAIHKRNPS